jgi:hypothetical protein
MKVKAISSNIFKFDEKGEEISRKKKRKGHIKGYKDIKIRNSIKI